MSENEIARIVFNLGMKVHKELGPGLLESVYEECLHMELTEQGLNTKKQVNLPIKYRDRILSGSFRADLIIENKFLIELKCVNELNNLHLAQTLTYLKMTNIKLGMLINFNAPLFKDGVRRVINGRL